MAVSYNKLWKLLIDKKISAADLRRAAVIAPNTMTKLRRDEVVALRILDRICDTLGADYGDIMEHVKESNEN
jgi:DNA-binding Xre family transcriptional regulator